MHDELRRIVPTLDADARGLTLHVGVNTGHVVAGMIGGDGRSEYSILGDATNMAQRLESNAPAGETYVGESTVLLAGERFEVESVGELTLEGKPLPVPAWRLLGRRTAGADRGHAPPARLVGRGEELRALLELMAGDFKGVGGLAAIVGEPSGMPPPWPRGEGGRMRKDPKIEMLRRVPALAAYSDAQLADLAALVDELVIESGHVLTREGTTGREAFLIVDGAATVTIEGELVATVGSGQFVGEMSLLERQPCRRRSPRSRPCASW